jgi:hypothetical protein
MSEKPSLRDVYPQLIAPFPIEDIEIKPGATSRDKSKALALPYADIRVYQDRLDEVVGPENWAVEYRDISESSVFCRLTILGVVREDVGECHKTDKDGVPDENRSCSAVAQAFKRTCSAFGIGRYIYSLPQIWGEFDGQKKQFVDALKVVADIYKRAGFSISSTRRGPAVSAPYERRGPSPAPNRPERSEPPAAERSDAQARPSRPMTQERPAPERNSERGAPERTSDRGPERAAPERVAERSPERAAPVAEAPKSAEKAAPARMEKPAPAPSAPSTPNAPRGAPAAPPPLATSREQVLSMALQKATDGAALSNIAEGITQAKTTGEIDDAAQERLRHLYREAQTRLGLRVQGSGEERPASPRRK